MLRWHSQRLGDLTLKICQADVQGGGMSSMLGSWPGREENAKNFAVRMHRIRPATQAQSTQRPWLFHASTLRGTPSLRPVIIEPAAR